MGIPFQSIRKSTLTVGNVTVHDAKPRSKFWEGSANLHRILIGYIKEPNKLGNEQESRKCEDRGKSMLCHQLGNFHSLTFYGHPSYSNGNLKKKRRKNKLALKLLSWLKAKFFRRKVKAPKPEPSQQRSKPLLETIHEIQRKQETEWEQRRRTREIEFNLKMARNRPTPKPSSKFFKPRPSLERKTWKPDKKPDETD